MSIIQAVDLGIRRALTPDRAAVGRSSNQGLPRSRPSALASREAATTMPSLLESTTSGTLCRAGLKTRSKEA